jgi:multiple sugar transport system permease protein
MRPHQLPRKLAPFAAVLTYAVLIVWASICLFPLYWVAVTSLQSVDDSTRGPLYLPFVDFRPTLAAWAEILFYASEQLLSRYFNSTVIAVGSTLLTLLIGAMAAYGLTRFRYAVPAIAIGLGSFGVAFGAVAFSYPVIGRSFFLPALAIMVLLLLTARFLPRGPALRNEGIYINILFTRLLPPVSTVIPIYFMAMYTGTLDTRFALTFVNTAANLPLAVWLLRPVFGEVATEQEEAARLDGASHFRIFFGVLLPMVAGAIVAVGFFVFVLCWNEYLFAVYLTGEHAMTLPPWLAGQMSVREAAVGGDQEERLNLSAAIILTVLPLVALTGFAQRFLSRLASWRR